MMLGMQGGLDYQPQVGALTSSDHTFCLRKSSEQDAAAVLVRFSPQAFGSANEKEDCSGPAFYKSFPVFNDDGKHFTPSFMLHYDKVRTPNNLPAFQLLHTNRVLEIAQQKIQLFVPKPSKANSFCSVCRSCYQDYLEHVTLAHHQQLLSSNKFAKEIGQLCLRFSKNGEEGHKRCKGKRIRKAKVGNKGSAKEMFCSVSTEIEVSPIENE